MTNDFAVFSHWPVRQKTKPCQFSSVTSLCTRFQPRRNSRWRVRNDHNYHSKKLQQFAKLYKGDMSQNYVFWPGEDGWSKGWLVIRSSASSGHTDDDDDVVLDWEWALDPGCNASRLTDDLSPTPCNRLTNRWFLCAKAAILLYRVLAIAILSVRSSQSVLHTGAPVKNSARWWLCLCFFICATILWWIK